MTPTQATPPSPHKAPLDAVIKPVVHWKIKEWQNGLWVTVREFKNVVTTYGLTTLAMAPGGNYIAPTFLVINNKTAFLQGAISPGAVTLSTNTDPTNAGDTQIVLSVGLATQETVTFSSKTGSGPYTFTLSSGCINAHANSDPIVRAATSSDTMSSVAAEQQYDSTNAPNMRVQSSGVYSPGSAQGTMQFYMSGQTATNLFFSHVGLADQLLMTNAATNLHNYAPLGYNHNNTNDVEIDVTYTLQVF